VFALGIQRAGLLGAVVASTCFTLPSALLMIGFAQGVARASALHDAGWLHGLKLAAVAVVAQGAREPEEARRRVARAGRLKEVLQRDRLRPR
jgi:chromate transport protein ChrA